MSDLGKRLRFNSTAGVPDFTNSKLLEEAADRVDTMETMLQAMADGRIVMLARIEALEADFNSAAAAASEYSEFWEQHHGDFDQFGNYVPYSQMDGDLRAANARIKALEEVLLVQKEIAGRTMTDIVAAANKDATAAVERIEALEAALEASDTLGKFWQARAIKAEGIPAAIASPAQPPTTFAQPAAWRVDGIRDGAAHTWVYWKPDWPDMHAKEGDKVTPLYAAPLSPAQPLTTDTIDLANPLPGDPPIQQQPNDAVFRGFRGNNEA